MAKNSTTDIELLAGLSIDSSEQEILRAIKIIEKRLKANHDARFKLNVDIDETVINNTITKLQNALKNKDLKIETQDSIVAITKEANAMLDVVDSAKRATQEKLEFAKANQKVRNSADDTAEAINRERIAMDNLDDIDVILQNLNMNGRQGNSVFQQFGATLRDAFSTYTVANLLQDAIYKVVDTGKEALDTVKKFDDINVDLQMATGADKDYVKGLISDYAELGGELGALTETVAESADTFLRQGRSMEETSKLISDAVVLGKVAKTEGEKASEILTATINGFQLAASEGSRVNDVLSSIDLNSASSAEGIGEALTKVASMANNAGVSLEKTAAMIATIKDVTQDADTTIGTSLKTVLSRMNQIRAGKFIDESTGEALNDVEKVLGTIGVSMRDVNGQFKEAEAIIDDVGIKWKSLDSNTQKAVTTAMGGVYQANKLVSLFDNYDKVIELTRVAEESAGTALQKFNDSYLTSLEAKTNSLKSSLQSLATTTISDEFYGSVLDSTKAIVDMTTETGILKGALAGLATAGAVYTFQHLTSYLHDATQEFANLGEAMQITRGATGTITDIQRLIDLTGGLSESQTRLLLNTRSLTDAQRTAILMNQYLAQGMDDDLARATAEATLQTWGLTTAQKAATGAGITLRNTLTGIAASLMANPLILISTAVTLGVTAFNKYKQAQEETIRATKEAAEEANTLSDEISGLATKYIRLSDAVKTDASVKEDLVSTQTELIKKLGLESEEIDNLITKYGSLSEAIKRVSVDKLRESQIDLIAGLNVAKDELLKAGDKGFFKDKNIINATGEDAVKAFQELEKVGIIDKGSYTSRGGALVLTGDDETVEGVLENYKQLGDALKALRNKFTSDELSENTLYQNIHKRYDEIKDEAESYESIIENINENLAQQMTFVALYDKELPNTKGAFEGFRDELLKTATASGEFIGSEQTIENVLDAYLETLPEFEKFYSDLSEIQGSTPEDDSDTAYISEKQKEAIESYKKTLDKISKIRENASDYSLTDLMSEFPEYNWSNYSKGVESLDTALVNIANGGLLDVRNLLADVKDTEPIFDDLRQQYIQAFSNTDFGLAENQRNHDFLSNLLTELQNGKVLTRKELDEILGIYGEFFDDIQEVEGGYTIDTDAVISEVNKSAEAYNESLQKKLEQIEKAGIDPDKTIKYGNLSYKELIEKDDETSPLDDLEADLKRLSSIRELLEAEFDNATTIAKKEHTYRKLFPAIIHEFQKEIEIAKFNGNAEEADRLSFEMHKALHDAKEELLNFKKDNASALKDLAQNKLDANPNASLEERAEWYKELETATSNYYNAEIELAKHNKDAIAVENLELEKKMALQKVHMAQLEEQKDYYEQIISAVERRYDKEIDKVNKDIEVLQELNETLEEQKSDYDAAISTVTDFYNSEKDKLQASIDSINEENELLQKQIDEYDGLLNAVTLVFDEERSALESEQKLIDDRISSLQEENDERNKALALEQAKYDLARLQTQRTKKVLTEQGFVYTTDDKAISDARDKVADLEFDATIDALEKEKELLQEIIDELNETEKAWSKISSAFDDNKALSSVENLLGKDYKDIILNADRNTIEDFTNRYSSARQTMEDNEVTIKSIEEEMEKYDELIKKWEDIATAKEEAIQREITASILGHDWQQRILDEEQRIYSQFKDDYLIIEGQILDNEQEIKSLEEKRKGYEDLKDEWTKLLDSQQELQDGLLLSQTLGTIDELGVLGSRLQNWKDFRDEYLRIQKEIAEATASTTGSTTITTTTDVDGTEIPTYHIGLDKGYVGGALSDSKRLEILQKAGSGELKPDEILAKLQKGEVVLTKMQQVNIADNLLQRFGMPNIQMPDYSYLSKVVQRNNIQPVVQEITISCPNVTNESGHNRLMRELQQLPLYALQYSHRNN